jgi:DNA-binding winged helix-turn-helix (wHTH) protein
MTSMFGRNGQRVLALTTAILGQSAGQVARAGVTWNKLHRTGWTTRLPDQLVVEVRLRVRRPVPGGTAGPTVAIGDLLVDVTAKRVMREGHRGVEEIRLTPTEWHLLEALLRSPGKLITRQQLLAEVWGPGYARATGNLRLFMAQLRRKLEPDPARPQWFITEPGIGYRFQPVECQFARAECQNRKEEQC